MKYLSLGQSGIEISKMIMGTWQAGKEMWSGVDDAETTKAIRAAYQSGMATYDTAEMYGAGHSERILGKALKHVRSQVIYATKVAPAHLQYDQVVKACHRSLKNLNTDYIDLYQIHWPAGSFGTKRVPIEVTMRALNDLKHEGKIRAIGVSNFSRDQIKEACLYGEIVSSQPPLSLFWRQAQKDSIPYCLDNHITIMAYSPIAQGLLTGKFGPDHRFPKGDHRSRNKLFKSEHFERVHEALSKLRPIAGRLGASLGQLALAWVLAQPGTCAIAGARSAEQVEQNTKAIDLHLSRALLHELDDISRIVTEHLDNSPVLWA